MKYRYREPHEMKDSGVEWLGLIPKEWDRTKIKRLSRIGRGASPRPIDNPNFFDDNGEYAWTRISDVSSSGKYLKKTIQRMSDLGSNLSVKLEPGNLFLSIAGSVGKPCIPKIKACIHDGFVYFPDLSKQKIELLYTLFDNGQCYLGLGKLGTQLNLNRETVGNIDIVYPKDNSELDMLLKFVNKKIAEFDEVIEKKEKLIEKLEEAKKSLISEVVTGKKEVISNKSYKIGDDEQEREVFEYSLRNREPHEMKDSGIEWLGMIPEEWEVKRIKNILKEPLKYGANESAELDNRSFPRYIRITDFGNDGKLKDSTFKSLEYEKAKNYFLNDGDILFARSGATVGKTFQFKNHKGLACFAGYLIKAVPNTKIINSDLFYLFTKSKNYENWKNSIFFQATIQNIGADKYRELKLAIPKIEEQDLMVKFLGQKINKFDSIIQKNKDQIKKIKEAKQSLISEAVTGKIEVL